MWISARPESYSNMPTSKMPTTVNCLRRGSTAAGVTRPCGAISVTLSPMPTLQRPRQFRAKNDAEFAGYQIVRSGRPSCAGRSRPPSPPPRAGCRAPPRRAPAGRRTACPAPARRARRPARAGVARQPGSVLAQSVSSPPAPDICDVRGDAEDARAQLLLEAVHHRQHDDQRRHAEADAEHGNQRDEGDEVVAPLCPRVAEPDPEFITHGVAC